MRRLAVWDSEWCGWICCALLVFLGLPLFVCLPLWCDVTLYDVAARNVLEGGVHYRDVFDTNMPGVVWIHVLVRSLAGWSSEVLRLFDAAVLAAIIVLLARWLRDLEVSQAGRAWFAVGVVLFYLFQPEVCHCQRDLWLLLPALLAVGLRRKRLASVPAGDPSLALPGCLFPAVLEGCLWGLAIWIKPHVLIPILAVWLVSASWIAGPGPDRFRRLLMDALGLVLGGLLVGALGIGWLLLSGTWAPFWDVFLRWNPLYWEGVKASLADRYPLTFLYFSSWSLLHFLTLPLALCNLLDARFWSLRQTEPGRSGPIVRVLPAFLYWVAPSETVRRLRALLAALYLGWMAQALYLQQFYVYVHVPEMILALALLTAQRWSVGFAYLAWFAVAALVWHLGAAWPAFGRQLANLRERYPIQVDDLLPYHPLAEAERLALWPRCWREGSSPRLRDQLALRGGRVSSTSWVELEEVAEYLRRQGIADGELVCWDDSTHPLYLMLGIKPAIRFMHLSIPLTLVERRDDIRQNLLNATHKKYVVSDLLRVVETPEAARWEEPEDRLVLPATVPAKERSVFPWDQPIVFRSSAGRYVVHRISRPIERIHADQAPTNGGRTP